MNKTIKELKRIIFFDIGMLKDCRNSEDFDYHFKLAKGNLKDLLNYYERKVKQV